jgi:anti-anti-sigma factor
MPSFRCTLTTDGIQTAWVHVAGEVDLMTSPQLESTLREARSHSSLVILDTQGVTFIDSSGVHVILDANEASQRAGARLTLVPSTAVDRTFELVGVRDRISTFDLSSTEPAPALGLA